MPEHATSIHRTAGIKSAHGTGSHRLSDQAPLLFGADPTPRLLAFGLTEDGRGIRVWQRLGETAVATVEPFVPFVLLADPALVTDAAGLLGIDPLQGSGALRWRARFDSWPHALGARDLSRERSQVSADTPSAPYWLIPDPVQQYLLTSGRTSFGGHALR